MCVAKEKRKWHGDLELKVYMCGSWEFISEAVKHPVSLLSSLLGLLLLSKLFDLLFLCNNGGTVTKCFKTKLCFKVLFLCCIRFRRRGEMVSYLI
jgi:hypothetical protein